MRFANATPDQEGPMSDLRRKMLADLRIRNYAERTQEIYIARVAEMARHWVDHRRI